MYPIKLAWIMTVWDEFNTLYKIFHKLRLFLLQMKFSMENKVNLEKNLQKKERMPK